MDGVSRDDAKAQFALIEKALAARGIHPYAVRRQGWWGVPNSRTPQVYVKVDVVDGADGPAAGQYVLDGLHAWYNPVLIAIRCGMLDRLPAADQAYAAAWNMPELQVWATERTAWRSARQVCIPAVRRDAEERLFDDYKALKSRVAEMERRVKQMQRRIGVDDAPFALKHATMDNDAPPDE